jgi:hypothetical protein
MTVEMREVCEARRQPDGQITGFQVSQMPAIKIENSFDVTAGVDHCHFAMKYTTVLSDELKCPCIASCVDEVYNELFDVRLANRLRADGHLSRLVQRRGSL